MSDRCLTPSEHGKNKLHIVADDVHFVLDQHVELDIYSASVSVLSFRRVFIPAKHYLLGTIIWKLKRENVEQGILVYVHCTGKLFT